MELGLKNRVSLVTASSKGIGLGVAKYIASEGSRVVISSHSKENLVAARDSIIKETGNKNVLAVPADLTLKDEVEELVDEAVTKFGPIDILAYNSGPPKPGTFKELGDADWDLAYRLLLMSAVWLTRRVIPKMAERKWGRLIYITSSTLRQPISNLVLSNTVRLSLAGLSKSLAIEYGPVGITSNGIMQGHILTDRQRQLAEDVSKRTGKSVEEAMKEFVKDTPANRYGQSEEVGNLVAFLASDKASYINGTMVTIDGGMIKSVF